MIDGLPNFKNREASAVKSTVVGPEHTASASAADKAAVGNIQAAFASVAEILAASGVDGKPVVTVDLPTYKRLLQDWQPRFKSTGRVSLEFVFEGVTFKAS